MTKHAAFTTASCCSCILLILSGGGRHAAAAPPGQARFSVRAFGATGDGKTLDTDAVNHAIAAAADAGGGVVEFPAGDYLCHSIRLRSHVAIHLGPGATIIAANPPREGATGGYDPAEPNLWNQFQDFGHSHWHNSLIWGGDGPDRRAAARGVRRSRPDHGRRVAAESRRDARRPALSVARRARPAPGRTLRR